MEIFGTTVNEITIALFGIIFTGIGVIIALIYNKKAIDQNSKNHKYQMTKDFFESYSKIQRIPENDTARYLTEQTNFCILVYDLYNADIVDKSIITGHLNSSFEETVWLYQTTGLSDDYTLKFLKWCDENGISAQSPNPIRMGNIKKIEMDTQGIKIEFNDEQPKK